MQSPTDALIASPTFDAAAFFRRAYASPLQQETENNVRAAATRNQPNDREGFYVKLLAVAIMSHIYDVDWAYIYRSQLLMLLELNRRMLPLAEAKTYYDKAAADNPAQYAHYSFDRWMGFMKGHTLLIEHASGMVEITARGKDFLKYLVHWGRYADDKYL